MIQRIQSLYLLIAALLAFGMLFLTKFFYVKIGIMSSFLFSVVAIFLYQKRKMQRFLVWLNILTNLGILVFLFFSLPRNLVFPIVIILFLILAKRAITKDENLIKSSNSIR